MCIIILLLSAQASRAMQNTDAFVHYDGFISLCTAALSKPVLDFGLSQEKGKYNTFRDKGDISDYGIVAAWGTASIAIGTRMLCKGLYYTSKDLLNITFNEKTTRALAAAPYLATALSSLHSAAYFGKTLLTGRWNERKTWRSGLFFSLNAATGITCLKKCAESFSFKK